MVLVTIGLRTALFFVGTRPPGSCEGNLQVTRNGTERHLENVLACNTCSSLAVTKGSPSRWLNAAQTSRGSKAGAQAERQHR